MKTQDLLKAVTRQQLKNLSRSELVELLLGEQNIRKQIEQQRQQVEEEKILLEEKYVLVKRKLFAPSSEKSPKEKVPKSSNEKKPRKNFSKNLSDRYPNLEIREEEISLEVLPACSCCQSPMLDSGMSEDSEYLTVIPKKFLIVRQKRRKYRCGKCHGQIQTAPGLPRIASGSYSDEIILDVALSKFCDLIPIERYTMMASRQGAKRLPANSLIGITHSLADFVKGAYEKLPQEIKSSRVAQADETPHRMLEGAEKKNWYLWGFSSPKACYFEFHGTRSGDVAHEFLKDSKCEILLSDVFSGYNKAVRKSNEYRQERGLPLMRNAYCNAHSRRKFDEAKHPFKTEAEFYLEKYREIYCLESEGKNKAPEEILTLRSRMMTYYEAMKIQGEKDLLGISNKSSLARSINYFLNNFNELTLFIRDPEISIDNNAQERLIRNPVIGRKTWLGTHSVKGANTAAVLFSLVESCKMNKVNPREYFKELTQKLHQAGIPFTPWEYLQILKKTDD